MIPASFEYHRPQDMAGVLAVLEEHGDDARVMAGGHSLIPMMKLRMADVPHLIDLQDVGGLSGIEVGTDSIRIGALVTQTDIIDQCRSYKRCPNPARSGFANRGSSSALHGHCGRQCRQW